MRNLAEYPITKEEIAEALSRIADEYEKLENIGDMRPLLLRQAIQHLWYSRAPVNEVGLIFLDYNPNLRGS